MWLRRMLLVAWLPAIFIGLGFFMFENAAKRQLPTAAIAESGMLVFRQLPGFGEMATTIANKDYDESRNVVWSWLLSTFFRLPQGTLMLLVVGLIAPPLISQDLRSRAYLIYFSRPISIWEYVLGKAAVVMAYLAMITTVAAWALYILGVMLSPDLSVLQYTWDLPLRILLASAVLIVPTTTLALCFSSLTRETRYAAFAWYVPWVLGWLAYTHLTTQSMMARGVDSLGALSGQWTLLSLYHSLGRVQNWVFGLEHDRWLATYAAMLLVTVAIFTTGILFWRVKAPLRE
jgi:hypothetical protein